MRPLLIIPALLAVALIYIAADQGSGLSTWMRHQADLENSEERIAHLEAEIARLGQEVRSLQADPFAIERAIREDLEYARPKETVIRLPSGPGSISRNP